MSLAVKPKYSTDLAGQMAETEANYARLMKLLPSFDSADSREFAVELPGQQSVHFLLTITERCRYTTMLEFCQQQAPYEWAPAPRFSLRVYHDARMAEVVAFRQHRRLMQRYQYPNDNMFQRDEKAQLNKLLGEWLTHCLTYGHAIETLPICEESP